MYQPPAPQHRPSRAAKPLALGCGGLFAAFVLLAGCGALLDSGEPGTPDAVQTVVPQAAATPPATPAPTPEPTVTSLTPTPTPTPTIDAAARKACAAHVKAVALRKAGWTGKADAQDLVAEDAVSESSVTELTTSYDKAETLASWCPVHFPHVKAAPVSRKPAPKPKPKPKKTVPAAPATDPRFGTCREANAHGYGDYVRGEDPEYAWYQDRDGDGVVCER